MQERKLNIIKSRYMPRDKQYNDYEAGKLEITLTNKIDPLRDVAIQLYFSPFLAFIIRCGGRIFQQVLFEYISSEFPKLKGNEKDILDNMKDANLVKIIKFPSTTSNIVEATSTALDYYNQAHLSKFNTERLWKGTYIAYSIIEDSKRVFRRNKVLKGQGRSFYLPDEAIRKMEYRNIDLYDCDDKYLYFVLFDTQQNLDVAYFRKLLKDVMIDVKKEYKIVILTFNEDREEVLDKLAIKVRQEAVGKPQYGFFRGIEVENMDIEGLFYPSASHSRIDRVKKKNASAKLITQSKAMEEVLDDII